MPNDNGLDIVLTACIYCTHLKFSKERGICGGTLLVQISSSLGSEKEPCHKISIKVWWPSQVDRKWGSWSETGYKQGETGTHLLVCWDTKEVRCDSGLLLSDLSAFFSISDSSFLLFRPIKNSIDIPVPGDCLRTTQSFPSLQEPSTLDSRSSLPPRRPGKQRIQVNKALHHCLPSSDWGQPQSFPSQQDQSTPDPRYSLPPRRPGDQLTRTR